MKPQWQKVYDALASDIGAGIYSPGERLPSEHDLSASLGVSRNTVRRAFLSLSQDGFIRIVNGRGSYVTPHGVTYEIDATSRFRQTLESLGIKRDQTVIENTVVAADGDVAAALGLSPGDDAVRHVSVIWGDGTPFLLSRRYFPASLVPHLAEEIAREHSFTRVLQLHNLGDLHRDTTTVSTRLPDQEEARLLSCPLNAPVLEVLALGRLADGRIAEWQNALMPGSLVRLTFKSASQAL
ncbi:GntR family transcriptional regulator [Pseudochelatococcus lubricantis]|uniref:GntR family transcriptional regulator n=1 Tax=Pseudochelatococcus lubricantis TaxID=1538102 RepID=UPI0035ED912D